MGMFVNPDNSAFQVALNSEIYIDKSGLINYTNKVLNTLQGYICNSRPRRFGKSVTANMLTAYYSRGCDSEGLFADLEISKSAYESWKNSRKKKPDFYEACWSWMGQPESMRNLQKA